MQPPSDQRRRFLKQLGLLGLSSLAMPLAGKEESGRAEKVWLTKPPALKKGDTIAIAAPAGVIFQPEKVAVFEEKLRGMGLVPVLSSTLYDKHGYFAGKDEERAKELNRLFADPSIKGIIAMRGGWGSMRILPMLDFKALAHHPKVIMGFSDITALLFAITAKSHLITFHGPMGNSAWGEPSTSLFMDIVFGAKTPELVTVYQPEVPDSIYTITPGKAHGHIMGGNLSVLTSLIGTPYEPHWDGKILFLEEVKEEPYRIDRMLNHLKLAGVLNKISGFIFGKCIECEAEFPERALTFRQVLEDAIKPLGVPAFYGAMIGHLPEQFVIPIGGKVEMNADTGTLRLLESAVHA